MANYREKTVVKPGKPECHLVVVGLGGTAARSSKVHEALTSIVERPPNVITFEGMSRPLHIDTNPEELEELVGRPEFFAAWGTHLDECDLCRNRVEAAIEGIEPDPDTESFVQAYEGTVTDLKREWLTAEDHSVELASLWKRTMLSSVLRLEMKEGYPMPWLLSLRCQPRILHGPECRIKSRHQLIKVFMRETVFDSGAAAESEYRSRILCLRTLCRRIVKAQPGQVTSFEQRSISVPRYALDERSLSYLERESIIDLKRHQARFHHPLLQDFAMARWCLYPYYSNDNDDTLKLKRISVAGAEPARFVAERLSGIQDPRVRVGCLRSVIEHLVEDGNSQAAQSAVLSQGSGFLVALFSAHGKSDPDYRILWRAVLGRFGPEQVLDPGVWASESDLPEEARKRVSGFATVLLRSLADSGNTQWESAVAKWPAASWSDTPEVLESQARYMGFVSGYRSD